jgi:Na+/melibiose symporter-like transporter
MPARGKTPDESSGQATGLLATVREVVRRPLPFRGWRHTLTVWAVLFAAVIFKAIARAMEGRDLFFSYVTLGGMLFVCSIFTLWRLIETTKQKNAEHAANTNDSNHSTSPTAASPVDR